MSYSYDIRQRAVRYVEEGGRVTAAARLFGVHRQTVQGWIRLARGDGLRETRKPGPRGGRKVTETALRQALLARPDAKLKELGAVLQVHPSTVHYVCRTWRISRKKTWGYRERDARRRRDYLGFI